MESPSDESSKVFERTEPRLESEVDELAIALRKLAEEGIALPKHLIRHAYTGEILTTRMNGFTLDAMPKALDRLGAARETAAVGLVRRFEQAVRDHLDHVKNRVPGAPLDKRFMRRYLPSSRTTLRSSSPLGTVRDTFASHGSSIQ